MSDFGILLSAIKKNGKAFSSNEKSTLKNYLKDVIKDNDFRDMLGELFQHEFDESGGTELIVQLSEHYFGDEEPDEAMEFVEENEFDDAEKIVKKMSAQFPEVTFKVSMEEW